MKAMWGIAALALATAVGCAFAVEQDRRDTPGRSEEAITGNVSDFSEAAIGNPVNLSGTRVRSLYVDGSRVFVGGSFAFTTGGTTYKNLVAFDLPANPSAVPTLVTGFRPQPDDTVWAITGDGSKIWVGGEFVSIGGQSRARLAALSRSTGSADTTFLANVSGDLGCATCLPSPPNSGDPGVHALTLSGTNLIVGGNFTDVKGVPRHGLAVVDKTTGGVSTTRFTSGVSGGFVQSLRYVSSWSRLVVGGTFTSIQGQTRPFLALATDAGVVDAAVFDVGGQPVLDLDVNPTANAIYVGTGGTANNVSAFLTMGARLWQSPRVDGDAQTVHYYSGAVYFGFHDGMWVDGTNGNPGDRYKLAAVNATNGTLLVDKLHVGSVCNGSHQTDCFAPLADPTSSSAGFWGLWTIEHYTSTSGTRLLVGGDVNQWNGVANTGLFASFGP